MERFLLVSFALCLCFAEVTAQCRWDFDLNITQQMNSIYPPPKSLVCGLFASDTVTFVNQGSQAYYVVRLDGPAGFSSCDMSAGTIIESMPFPLMIPANGQLSFTLSRATSGFWDFFVGDEIYFISNGTDECLNAAFTVRADLNRNCDPLSFNGECMAPPTTTTVSTQAGTTTTSTPAVTADTLETTSMSTTRLTPVPPGGGVKGPVSSPPLKTVDIVLIVLIVVVAVLLIIAICVLAALVILWLIECCAKRKRMHTFAQMSTDSYKMT